VIFLITQWYKEGDSIYEVLRMQKSQFFDDHMERLVSRSGFSKGTYEPSEIRRNIIIFKEERRKKQT
jgi:hypothetical protein